MTARYCRSKSQYGNCGLRERHQGNHAVYIGDDVWFAYERRSKERIGYMLRGANGGWAPL